MFSKLKQFKELRDRAKTFQSALAEEKIIAEKNGIEIKMDGNMHIDSVSIKNDLTKEELEKKLPEALNSAIAETQKKMAVKMREMGGLGGL